MALSHALHHFEIQLNDTDRNLTCELRLRPAQHPSETLERVWLRVLALCWRYEERLAFGPGLSDPDTPDLVATDLTGEVTRWMRVGKAEPGKIQRAIDQNSRAKVSVLFESALRLSQFLEQARAESFPRLGRAELAAVDAELLTALAASADRRHKVTVTLAGDHFYLDRDGESFDGALTLGNIAAPA